MNESLWTVSQPKWKRTEVSCCLVIVGEMKWNWPVQDAGRTSTCYWANETVRSRDVKGLMLHMSWLTFMKTQCSTFLPLLLEVALIFFTCCTYLHYRRSICLAYCEYGKEQLLYATQWFHGWHGWMFMICMNINVFFSCWHFQWWNCQQLLLLWYYLKTFCLLPPSHYLSSPSQPERLTSIAVVRLFNFTLNIHHCPLLEFPEAKLHKD